MTDHPPPCPHRTYAVSPEAALLTPLKGWQSCWLNQRLLLSLPVPWNSLLSSTLELTLVSHWLLPCPPPSGHSLILLLWAAVDTTYHPCVYSPDSITRTPSSCWVPGCPAVSCQQAASLLLDFWLVVALAQPSGFIFSQSTLFPVASSKLRL